MRLIIEVCFVVLYRVIWKDSQCVGRIGLGLAYRMAIEDDPKNTPKDAQDDSDVLMGLSCSAGNVTINICCMVVLIIYRKNVHSLANVNATPKSCK